MKWESRWTVVRVRVRSSSCRWRCFSWSRVEEWTFAERTREKVEVRRWRVERRVERRVRTVRVMWVGERQSVVSSTVREKDSA